MDLWEIYKASKGVPHSGDMYDALMGKALGGGGSVWETENAPYLFRQSGGALNSRLMGKEKDCLVGASVGWSQLVKSGDISVTVTSGHKYYANINGSKTIGSSNGSAISINDSTKDNVVDLTLMLGSTIADYAHTLESGTAGAGIAWLKSYGFFDKPYYAYDNGSLQSVNATKHITRGKNWFDKSAYDDASDYPTFYNNYFYTDPIYLAPNTEYTMSPTSTASLGVSDYYVVARNNDPSDPNAMNFVSADFRYVVQAGTPQSITFTTGATGTIRLAVVQYGNPHAPKASALEAFMSIDYQIEMGSTATAYEPYEAHEYPLADLELRGVFKMDADHNIYAEGDTYEADGTVTRKYGEITFDGTEDWYSVVSVDENTNRALYTGLASLVTQGAYSWDFVATYILPTYEAYSTPPLWKANFNSGGYLAIGIPSTITTVAEWKTYLSNHPLTMVYKLATPTTDTAEPFASPQNVDGAGTEEYVTTQNFVPIGHETQYKCTPTP